MRIAYEAGLKGRSVVDAGGRVIGEVDGLVFESEDWRIQALRVKLRRETADRLGRKGRMFRSPTLDVPREAIQSVGDAVILCAEAKDLRSDGSHSPPRH